MMKTEYTKHYNISLHRHLLSPNEKELQPSPVSKIILTVLHRQIRLLPKSNFPSPTLHTTQRLSSSLEKRDPNGEAVNSRRGQIFPAIRGAELARDFG